ncbi:MAG: FAD-linked oxidase C-terminal domain-containing protein [Planctomycetota bacterium]
MKQTDYHADFRGDPRKLGRDMAGLCRGGVAFDDLSRARYATDGSLFRIRPLGVAFPADEADVARICRYADDRRIPVLPRGGGTSLAGQTVGEAVVLDFTRHLRRVISFDPGRRTVRVPPGIPLDELNRFLAPHGLKFAPDPASSAQACIGGMIGNNTTGAHSLVHGKTDAYVRSLRVVLANGQVVITRPLPADEGTFPPAGTTEGVLLRGVRRIAEANATEIARRFPPQRRNVSGYNLAGVLREGVLDLSKLVTGAEGTLGVVTEAELELVPLPKAVALVVLFFRDLDTALGHVPVLLESHPAALELLDGHFLALAARAPLYRDQLKYIPGGTEALLQAEFDGGDAGETLARARAFAAKFAGGAGPAFAAAVADLPADRAAWADLRKAALPVLGSRLEDARYVEFIEDTAVPAERLAGYVREFQEILARYHTHAAFYGHAGPGCLHVRPLLNLKTEAGVAAMMDLAEAVTDLVVRHGGAVSGEHGDGISRTRFNRKMYGEPLWKAFGEVKSLFDPRGIMNPGKVSGEPPDPRTVLREGPGFHIDVPPAALDYRDKHDLARAAAMCNGCGGCRKTDGGVMCPTFRPTREERLSTRGRVNVLIAALSGNLPPGTLESPEFRREVLDTCLACKGCARECQPGVDFARLRAEFLHHHHRAHGVPLGKRLFASARILGRAGCLFAPLTNFFFRAAPVRVALEAVAGIDRRRPLPRYASGTFEGWYRREGRRASNAKGERKVLLLADCFTNFHAPAAGIAAFRVLTACGAAVAVARHGCCGRPAYSQGMLDTARWQILHLAADLRPWVEDGFDIVGVEPGCVSMIREDAEYLLGPGMMEPVASRTYDVMEYLGKFLVGRVAALARDAGGRRVALHAHCHEKAAGRAGTAAAVLRMVPGLDVAEVDSSCCGMAGSFGYGKGNYDLSMAVGEELFRKLREAGGEPVAAGFSCRTQVKDGMGVEVRHPVEILAAHLRMEESGQ